MAASYGSSASNDGTEAGRIRAHNPGVKRQLARDAAWSWFADPRAVRSGDTTFVGYVTRRGHIEVAAVTGRETTVHRLHSRLARNDHASPALVVRPDGRIVAFYSAHNGPAMLSRVTERPGDITAWGPETTIGAGLPGNHGHTYPNPVRLGDMVLLFWRGPRWNPVVAESNDDATTWSTPQTLLDAPDRPYVKVAAAGRSIHMAYTDGHPDGSSPNRIWYLERRDDGFYRADGTSAGTGLPLRVEAGDLVHDGGSDWVWDVAAHDDGRPAVAFSSIEDRHSHRYCYASFEDGRWVVHDLGDAGGSIQGDEEWAYSAGIAIDHDAPSTVYLIRRAGRGSRLERMTLRGGRWETTRLARSKPGVEDLRPTVVRGHEGSGPVVLWLRGRYDHYRDYDLRLLGWPAPGDPA